MPHGLSQTNFQNLNLASDWFKQTWMYEQRQNSDSYISVKSVRKARAKIKGTSK